MYNSHMTASLLCTSGGLSTDSPRIGSTLGW
jgi:hypothetical protein